MINDTYKSEGYFPYLLGNGNTKALVPGDKIIVLEEKLDDFISAMNIDTKEVFSMRKHELEEKFTILDDSFHYKNPNFTTVVA